MDALASFLDRASYSTSTAAPSLSAGQQWPGSEMLTAWLALQLAGQATLPFLILTMLFHKRITRRNPTIINLCIVFWIATIPPLLLFYAGKYKGPEPDVMLCLVQAATVGGIAPMASVAYLSVVIHACTVISGIINANVIRPISVDYRIILLMSAPYVTFLTFSLLIAIVGVQNPGDVHRHQFFCEVTSHHLSLPMFGFSIIVVLLTLVAQVYISFVFYRNWSAKRKGLITDPGEVSHVDFQFLIRMILFTVFELVILVACIGTVLHPNLGPINLLLATPPFAVFLIFASSRDILRAWFPCFFPRKPTRSLADVEVSSQARITGIWDEKSHTPRPSTSSSITRPSMVEVRPRRYDLEMGIPHPPTPDSYQSNQSYEPTHHPTMVSIYSVSPNSESPLRTIRTLRSPAVPRPIHLR